MSIAGGCRCGAIRYRLAIEGLPLTYACHCRDCQTSSGSAFALNALLPEEALQEVSQIVRTLELEGRRGINTVLTVCPGCSTRIATRVNVMPGMVMLSAGTLDRSDELQPAIHMWTKRKQKWLVIPDGVACFEESPTPEEFAAAVQRAGQWWRAESTE
jgi:hypothetical protein